MTKEAINLVLEHLRHIRSRVVKERLDRIERRLELADG
jgi:hypothetical protein